MACQGSSSIKSDKCPFHDYCDDEVIKIQELKSSLSLSELNDIRKGKGDLGTHKHEVNHGFNRVSAKYFSEVINALSVKQRKITVNGKFIPFNKMSVHKVLGIPIGGDSLSVDREVGKTFILSRFNLSTLPPIRFFGDKIKNKQLLADDDMFICFMIVALSFFLCPNSNTYPSTKYMIAFKDLSCVGNIDWSLYIYEWLIDAVRKLCMGVGKSFRPIHTLDGCSYVLAVLYLDCLNFGIFDVPRVTPRISV
ncbi:hypothetical protein PVAP13_4NG125700 [Panicum virgatum]|uniref:Ubiquitin-like protease family profile domain-containing protein n=1 Tax=Panicum virgatum TaxID=38727 RepID=A0A8T0T768_PANVG|nr:hypothetical protein PVAP13_4NG125700 [Panicum virgatum]